MAKAKTLVEQLSDKFLIGDGCWPWVGRLARNGYGTVKVKQRERVAHRVVYEWLVGPIPKTLQLDHICHNQTPSCDLGSLCPHRRCVRPDHLVPKTGRDNRNSSPQSPSQRTRCPKGHPYDEVNTYRDRRGGRHCRICQDASLLRARDKLRQREDATTHCKRGHELTPENTQTIRVAGKRPWRRCRTCYRLRLWESPAKTNRRRQRERAEVVACLCGCGATFARYDRNGRERRFAVGHYLRRIG